MNPLLQQLVACDCHSHVYGPYSQFPLSAHRTFDPPESPIEALESIWSALGIERAVLVQGSAYAGDHQALLSALQRSPSTRRGVALIDHNTSESHLTHLHSQGIRAVRLNWVPHLLQGKSTSPTQRIAHLLALHHKISPLGWHMELHLAPSDLSALAHLELPTTMRLVIDHMARIDLSTPQAEGHLERLCDLITHPNIWVKLSGADRLTAHLSSLDEALAPMRRLLQVAPDRCLWGLDWPHVNLDHRRTDADLTQLLITAAGDPLTLRKVLVENPARLYGFPTKTS